MIPFKFTCVICLDFNKFFNWHKSLLEATTSKQHSTSESLLEIAFSNQFMEADRYIFNKLQRHIKRCLIEWRLREIYVPIVVICQSSGYGKSKSIFEYAATNITSFICLRNEKHDGYPPRSSLAQSFIKYLEKNLIEAFLLALVETSLEFYDLIFEDNPNKSQETIALEYRKYQPWLS